MKPSKFLWVLGCIVLLGAAAVVPVPVEACPFCSAPSLTLTEQLSGADTAVLVKWIGGTPAKVSDAGTTQFEVVEVVQQQAGGKLKSGSKLDLIRYRSGKAGDLFLLLGTLGGANIEWGSPLEVSQAGYDYMKNSPKPDQPAPKRLGYFLKYLENPDPMISDDAFGEFANASYADVVQLSKEMPREKLRTWLLSSTTSPGRIGLYGMMLGLCGTDEDVALMESKILEPKEEFRLGIDGVMGGYLLLTGDKGLAVLEEKKLKDKKAPFSETYAAMQALRFMWQYGDNKISPDRLRQSMRILLERPELADLVIADLARMKDWSVQNQLIGLYEEDAYNIPSIKRAIVRFTLAAAKDTGIKKGDGEATTNDSTAIAAVELPAHVVRAQECLVELEKRDPKTVHEAKRFFLLK
jgi:hypothetical protein